jgi:hypothetical protein
MTSARDLRTASRRELRDHIVNGYPIDPSAIEGWAYRGTSLGLPGFVERLTWKTFQKTFYRDPDSGRLLGWNVRLEQDGIDAPSRPKMKGGVPLTEWNYEVIPPRFIPMPQGFDRGLVIDYSLGDNPFGPMRITKDPLVSLSPDNADELLGVSYLVVSGRCVETPTYFTLVRDHPVDYVPYEHPSLGKSPLSLTALERRWAEGLFAAILGTNAEDGLPPLGPRGTQAFFDCFGSAAAPLVKAGLRPMLYTLTFLPVVSGFRKPFYALTPGEQTSFLSEIEKDRRTFVRQAVTTLKTLACFAYFEEPEVRAHFDSTAGKGALS